MNDPITYGPTGIRCGCGKDAHSNLVPCRDDETAAAVAAVGALPVPVGDQPQPLDDTRLAEIRDRATSDHLTPGPWRLERESCDCGDGYGCRHGDYVTGVITPTPTEIALDRCKRTGEQPRDYDFHRSDIGDFTDADWELMTHARTDVPALLAQVERLKAELAEARTAALNEAADWFDQRAAAEPDQNYRARVMRGAANDIRRLAAPATEEAS